MSFRAQATDVCLKKWRTISVGESRITEQVPRARHCQVCTGLGFLTRVQCEPCRLFSCLVPTDPSHMPAWRGLSQNNSNSNINHSNIKERGAGFLGTWPRLGPGLDFPMGGLVLSWGPFWFQRYYYDHPHLTVEKTEAQWFALGHKAREKSIWDPNLKSVWLQSPCLL